MYTQPIAKINRSATQNTHIRTKHTWYIYFSWRPTHWFCQLAQHTKKMRKMKKNQPHWDLGVFLCKKEYHILPIPYILLYFTTTIIWKFSHSLEYYIVLFDGFIYFRMWISRFWMFACRMCMYVVFFHFLPFFGIQSAAFDLYLYVIFYIIHFRVNYYVRIAGLLDFYQFNSNLCVTGAACRFTIFNIRMHFYYINCLENG